MAITPHQSRILLVIGLAFVVLSATLSPVFGQATATSGYTQLLKDNWAAYRKSFVQPDGRVIDHRIGISTSEGQSYAMLRSVWMRDKTTFDNVYAWTKNNLQKRKGDKLFAWKWGQLYDKTWGPLDKTAASDADQDVVLSLILAHKLWGDDSYKRDALVLLNDIWNLETVQTPIGRVLLPGDWKFDGKQVQINPSYFAPYAYRIFAEFDRKHPWEQLVKTSYQITRESIALTKTKLPPDWVELSLLDGSVKLYEDTQDVRSDYGYEAIRVFWRFGVDDLITPADKRGAKEDPKAILTASNYLQLFWKIRGEFPGTVSWQGIPRKDNIESGAVYGASLPAFYYQDKTVTQEALDKRIIPNLKPGGQWNTPDDYYSQNWLWFGLATYDFLQKKVQYPKKMTPLERLEWFMDLPK